MKFLTPLLTASAALATSALSASLPDPRDSSTHPARAPALDLSLADNIHYNLLPRGSSGGDSSSASSGESSGSSSSSGGDDDGESSSSGSGSRAGSNGGSTSGAGSVVGREWGYVVAGLAVVVAVGEVL